MRRFYILHDSDNAEEIKKEIKEKKNFDMVFASIQDANNYQSHSLNDKAKHIVEVDLGEEINGLAYPSTTYGVTHRDIGLIYKATNPIVKIVNPAKAQEDSEEAIVPAAPIAASAAPATNDTQQKLTTYLAHAKTMVDAFEEKLNSRSCAFWCVPEDITVAIGYARLFQNSQNDSEKAIYLAALFAGRLGNELQLLLAQKIKPTCAGTKKEIIGVARKEVQELIKELYGDTKLRYIYSDDIIGSIVTRIYDKKPLKQETSQQINNIATNASFQVPAKIKTTRLTSLSK